MPEHRHKSCKNAKGGKMSCSALLAIFWKMERIRKYTDWINSNAKMECQSEMKSFSVDDQV